MTQTPLRAGDTVSQCDSQDERRQTDVRTVRRSLRTLDDMPDCKLFAPGRPVTPADVRGLRMLLQMAIRFGVIDLYTAACAPEWRAEQRTYNVWDYAGWEHREAHEWLARELARVNARESEARHDD